MTSVTVIDGDELKAGDRNPDLQVQLIKNNGNPKDLSSGSPTVTFNLAEGEETETAITDDSDGNVNIDDAATGKVSYSWQSGETNTPGSYRAEFKVEESGETTSFPNNTYFDVVITESLG